MYTCIATCNLSYCCNFTLKTFNCKIGVVAFVEKDGAAIEFDGDDRLLSKVLSVHTLIKSDHSCSQSNGENASYCQTS